MCEMVKCSKCDCVLSVSEGYEDEDGKPVCKQCYKPKEDVHINVSSITLGADKLFGRRGAQTIPLHELASLEDSFRRKD